MSERGIKEAVQAVRDVVGSGDCGPEDWVPLNGTPEEVKALRDALINERGLLKVSALPGIDWDGHESMTEELILKCLKVKPLASVCKRKKSSWPSSQGNFLGCFYCECVNYFEWFANWNSL